MRIEVIHFRNLASLEGEWEIDLTHPAYASYGLFAITGVTGAGKSTIFDAVRLALYRRTDRLESFATENEIMTRGTGECFARVRFRLGEKRYVATWQQARARKKAGNKLQPDTHILEQYLADGSLKMLAEKKSDTDRAIRELLHMDFGHFSRAMLLPQGEFAIFLKTPAAERSEILEQITGSEIYRRISAAAYRKFMAEQEQVTLARAGMEAIQLLTPEEVSGLQSELAGKSTEAEEKNRRLTEITALAENLKRREKLRLELAQYQTELEKTVPLEQEAAETAAKSQKSATEAELELEAARPALQNARLLDAALERSTRELARNSENLKKETEAKQHEEQRITALSSASTEAEKRATEAQQLLDQRPADAALITESPRLLAQMETVRQQQTALAAETARLEENTIKRQMLQKEYEIPKKALEECRKQLDQLAGKLLPEEAFLALNTRAALAAERVSLHPGAPCPLCGSPDHPYEGSEDTSAQELEEAKELRSRWKGLQIEEQQFASSIQEKATLFTSLDTLISESKRRIAEIEAGLRGGEKALAELLSPFGIRTREELQERRDARVTAEKNRETAAKTMEKNRTELTLLQARLDTRSERLNEVSQMCDSAAKEAEELRKERASLLSGRPAEEVERKLTAQLKNAREEMQLKTGKLQELQKELIALKTRLEGTEKNLAELHTLPETPATALEQEGTTLREALQLLNEETGRLKEKLRSNEEAAGRRKQEQKKLDAMRKELERWRLLNELIGKQDGGKFQLFAQSLIFRQLIALANQALKKFTDRYELISIPDSPLDFNVIDRYQCDEIRSVKNLSGGESFLVSMALALALSRMSGENLRIDTLFLDEGFGTLDEDTLERVLDQIQSLRSEGKLIGIITHAPNLENFVPLRIELHPADRSGRSLLTGPGVHSVIEGVRGGASPPS